MEAKNSLLIGALCFSLVVPTGCSTFQNMNNTGKDAIIGGAAGGAVGAGVGALIGGGKGAWIGALIGTAVGAGAGALIGNKMDKQREQLERELEAARQEAGASNTPVEVTEVKDSNNLKAIKVVLGDAVLFNTGSAQLNAEAGSYLSRVAYNLTQNPETMVTVVGHTDSTGAYDTNMRLSLQRAEAVKNYLLSKGVPNSRMITKGEGPNIPIASNNTVEGRSQNRRVELYITASEQMIKNAQMSN